AVQEAEGEGGWRSDVVYLPARMDFAEDVERNELAYVARVALVVTAMRHAPLRLTATADAEERALALVVSLPHVLSVLREELTPAAEACVALAATALADRTEGASPRQGALDAWTARALGLPPLPAHAAWVEWLERVAQLDWPEQLTEWRALEGSARALPLLGGLGTSLAEEARGVTQKEDHTALPSGTELAGRALENVERVELADPGDTENPLVHSFEKVHTAEEYQGGSKQLDGDDQLADHAQALEELDLRQVVRSTERARSLLRMDVMLEGAAGDLADPGAVAGLPYPEWDQRTRTYREGWCHVRVGRVRAARAAETAAMSTRAAGLRRETDALRVELERLEVERCWRSRQLDGSEIDEDAMVDRHACLAAGTTPPDRLNRQRRPSAPTVAALLLIDASLSTDGWVDDTRVLDLELDAALVLGEALASFDTDFGVAAFHSHTRSDCRFDVVKGFREPWRAARARLAMIQPQGYTRIGPALRHATTLLVATPAKRRLLLLLTDGKPNDYDRYEGRHGVADVRQAVREADAQRVHVHAFAIDHDARFHLPTMLGSGRHHLLRHPRAGPRAGRRARAGR
ncbi:MAG: VWA domain-containing protein, partial [Myxococcales bacterium]|nr:VWA domain-containing protein [Myxococcales bacterium]